MSNYNQTDLLQDTPTSQGLPKALHVLTILTFIGSALGLIMSLLTPMFMKFGKTMMDKAMTMSSELSAQQLADLEKSRRMMELTEANMTPLLILGVLGAVGCFLGALWMRKLKKDGFTVYVAAQIIPLVGSLILMGEYYFSDWKNYLGVLIPLIFIFLYARQRKHLLN